MNVKLLSIILAVVLFFLILELVRREKLTFKYASFWLLIALAAFFAAIFDRSLRIFSDFLGFELLSNFIFFGLLSLFVFLSLILTIFLCQQQGRNDRMAQKIGLLAREIEDLKEK